MYDRKLKNLVLKDMRKIYYQGNVPYIDWMGFKLDNENLPSYHHIEKKEELKKVGEDYDPTIENGAYLGKKSHELLHYMEMVNKVYYIEWNKLFRIINDLKTYPSEELWLNIYELREKTLQFIQNYEKTTKSQKI